MKLDPAAAAAGVRLIVHDTVGSTNAEARLFRPSVEPLPAAACALIGSAKSWVQVPAPDAQPLT